MQNMHFHTQAECEEGMQRIIGRAMFAIIAFAVIFGLVIPIHFACVLYNHWQNADRSIEEGGCDDL